MENLSTINHKQFGTISKTIERRLSRVGNCIGILRMENYGGYAG